jgi:hypothetical protein
MNLFDWIQFPKNQKEYIRWLDDPMTKIMIDGLRESFTSHIMSDPTPERALQQMGLQAGRDILIRRMKNLLDDVVPEGADLDAGKLKSLIDDGYSILEARHALSQFDTSEG